MTHPLTDEIIGQIQARHGGPRYGCYPDFRAAADWQLEQVIEWLEKTECNRANDLRAAMRPQK